MLYAVALAELSLLCITPGLRVGIAFQIENSNNWTDFITKFLNYYFVHRSNIGFSNLALLIKLNVSNGVATVVSIGTNPAFKA